MPLSQEPGFLRQEVGIEAGVHPESLGLAPDGAHRVLVVQQLHVEGGEGEHMGSQRDKPHVEGDAQESYGQEYTEETKPTQPHWTLH